jgi:hypothetical protein
MGLMFTDFTRARTFIHGISEPTQHSPKEYGLLGVRILSLRPDPIAASMSVASVLPSAVTADDPFSQMTLHLLIYIPGLSILSVVCRH